MDNQKLIMGIVTSPTLVDRYTACMNTWANDFDNIHFFGGNQTKEEGLVKISEAGEDWNSFFLKQQLGLKYLYEMNSKSDWYGLFSCDNVIYKNNLYELLSKHDETQHIILCQTYGRVINMDGLDFEIFAGGAGFLLSNSLMKKIYPLIDSFNEEWINNYRNGNLFQNCYACGDIAMSFFLKKHLGVNLTHVDGLYSQPPSFYKKVIDNPISFHYIKPHEMKSIYNSFN